MVIDMVQLRKLTRDLVANFPALDAEARVAKKGDIRKSVRFRAFFAVQNRTESDKSVTKKCKTVQNRAKRRQKSASFAGGFIKSCQVMRIVSRVRSQLSVISNQSSVLIDPPTCNSRTEMGAKGTERSFRGSSGTSEGRRGQATDATVNIGQIRQPRKSRHAESTRLNYHALPPPVERLSIFSGFAGRK